MEAFSKGIWERVEIGGVLSLMRSQESFPDCGCVTITKEFLTSRKQAMPATWHPASSRPRQDQPLLEL